MVAAYAHPGTDVDVVVPLNIWPREVSENDASASSGSHHDTLTLVVGVSIVAPSAGTTVIWGGSIDDVVDVSCPVPYDVPAAVA